MGRLQDKPTSSVVPIPRSRSAASVLEELAEEQSKKSRTCWACKDKQVRDDSDGFYFYTFNGFVCGECGCSEFGLGILGCGDRKQVGLRFCAPVLEGQTEHVLDSLADLAESHDPVLRLSARLLRTHGRIWAAPPLPADVEYGPLRDCFITSSCLAMRYRRVFAYCDGLLSRSHQPDHAWCVDGDGVAYDFTEPWAYALLGIPFTQESVRRYWGKKALPLVTRWAKSLIKGRALDPREIVQEGVGGIPLSEFDFQALLDSVRPHLEEDEYDGSVDGMALEAKAKAIVQGIEPLE